MTSQHSQLVEINGSYKEGGGQILRNAITYGVLFQKSVTIRNVRANRSKNQGVRPQHLMGMRLAVDIGNGGGDNGAIGSLIGGSVGSTEVSYAPHHDNNECRANEKIAREQEINEDANDSKVIGSNSRNESCDGTQAVERYLADTGTSGSIALLLQAAFLPALIQMLKCQRVVALELCGGTNADNAFVNFYFQCSASSGDEVNNATKPHFWILK